MKFPVLLILLLGIFFLSNISVYSQPFEFLWVNQIGDQNDDRGIGIASDQAGNTWTIGQGTVTILDTILTADYFLLKCNPEGEYQWIRKIGATVSAVEADDLSNSYVCGTFSDKADLGDTTLFSDQFDNLFVVKYDDKGHVLWARQAEGTRWNYPWGIVSDNDGNIGITGYFGDTLSFGNTNLISYGSEDIFILKYDPQGNALWAENAGGPYDDGGRSIAVDHNGNFLITGYFKESISFPDTLFTGLNAFDVITVKYDPDGKFLWARSALGPYEDEPWSIATDSEGNCFITGSFEDSLIFGKTTLKEPVVSVDLFVAKYTGNGDLEWALRAGGHSGDNGYCLTADSMGNCTVAGAFAAPATFGDTTLENSTGSTDIFIARFDPDGKLLEANQGGGSGIDWGLSLAGDAKGNNYLTGHFYGPAIFGDKELPGFGKKDLFIAKYGPSTVGRIRNKPPQLTSFQLLQNYPNPFNPVTVISWQLAVGSYVDLSIYNLLGEKVTTLVSEEQAAGHYHIRWDASRFASGVYYYRFSTDKGIVQSRKLVLIR